MVPDPIVGVGVGGIRVGVGVGGIRVNVGGAVGGSDVGVKLGGLVGSGVLVGKGVLVGSGVLFGGGALVAVGGIVVAVLVGGGTLVAGMFVGGGSIGIRLGVLVEVTVSVLALIAMPDVREGVTVAAVSSKAELTAISADKACKGATAAG